MEYNPQIHHRRSIRLTKYDYSQPGAYFITICTYKKQPWFGEIRHTQMHLNQLGKIVAQEWLRTPKIRPEIILDEWIIMPNHLHGIIIITDAVLAHQQASHEPSQSESSQFCRKSYSIPSIIAGFKSATTRQVNERRGTPRSPLWQRNYYESVVLNFDKLDGVRNYIKNNPFNWYQDSENWQSNSISDMSALDLPF